MAVYVQTSMFNNSLIPPAIAGVLRAAAADALSRSGKLDLAFVASEFEQSSERTDRYFDFFRALLEDAGLCLDRSRVVDGRMSPAEAQDAVRSAEVVWLSGGWTPTQWGYFEKYGLAEPLRAHKGLVIGMSAGSINMAETAASTETLDGSTSLLVYPALGLVGTTVEPHFDPENIAPELLEFSRGHVLYGLCDEAAIVCKDGEVTFFGDVYRIENGVCTKIS